MENKATQLQLRRGTTAENNAFIGAVGEITIDTEAHNIRIHDGVTAGGFPITFKNFIFEKIVPNYNAGVGISNGGSVPGIGYIKFVFGTIQDGYISGFINGERVVRIGSSGYQSGLESGLYPVSAGDVITLNSGSAVFYPLRIPS